MRKLTDDKKRQKASVERKSPDAERYRPSQQRKEISWQTRESEGRLSPQRCEEKLSTDVQCRGDTKPPCDQRI